jgi:hypothetical protein
VTEFFLDGHNEQLKGYVHAGVGMAVGIMALYNIAACWKQPRTRVAIGAMGYTALAGLEALVARQHFVAAVDSRRDPDDPAAAGL